MNTRPRSPHTSEASLRLAHSRAQIAHWLDRDTPSSAGSSAWGIAVRGAMPVLLNLRALWQAWSRHRPQAPVDSAATRSLEVVIPMARRHPAAALALAGIAAGLAILWWRRSSTRQTPP